MLRTLRYILLFGLSSSLFFGCQREKATAPCDGGHTDGDSVWHVDTLAVAQHVSVNGIWGVTPCDVYAVGSVTDSSGIQGVIWHYDGNRWSAVHTTPNAEFHDVYTVSSASVWVVGVSSPENYPGGALIAHGNGTQWQEQFSDPPARGLLAVWAGDDQNVYAVGHESTILRFNGATWRIEVLSSFPGDGQLDINDVWGKPAADGGFDVYAATSIRGRVGILLRRFPDGTYARWSEAFRSLVSAGLFSSQFVSVWIDADGTIWVLETYRFEAFPLSELYRFQRDSWSPMLPPDSGQFGQISTLQTLRGGTSGLIYVVGQSVYSFNGANWSSGRPGPVGFTLNDIWPSGATVFVCANSDSVGVILRGDGFTSHLVGR